MRPVPVVVAAVLAAVVTACAPGWLPASVTGRAALVEVGPLPEPGSFPASRLQAGTLPVRVPGSDEVYLHWDLVGVEPAGDAVRLSWDTGMDPGLPGCGSRPVAVEVEETATTVDIGLIGPLPEPAHNCLAVGYSGKFDVPLRSPAAGRVLSRWTG